MKVLVVDDEAVSRRAIAETLRACGYQATALSDAREALPLVRAEGFQLVVADWRMSPMDGIELCHAIRSANLHRYVYFIMVTSRNRSQDMGVGFANGVDDYLTKPFDPRELQWRVKVGQRIGELQSSQLTVYALAKLAESRDLETGAHLERVQCYCQTLAERLRQTSRYGHVIDDEYVSLIYQTSPLHDIGKVGIPDKVLLKPGPLTEAEFEVMKTHSLRGAETLEAAYHEFPNARFLRMAADIALTHHEKYDGTGYPQGLRGEAIPLCGRIVGLADAYDAITSRRIYKRSVSHEKAKAIISGERGRHFDPLIVDAFLELEAEFSRIRLHYAEQEARTHPRRSAPTGALEPALP